MTLGGMIKHLAFVEDWWFARVFQGGEYAEPWASVDWEADARLGLAQRRRRHARRSSGRCCDDADRRRRRGRAGARRRRPRSASREPHRPRGRAVQPALDPLHMIEEYARHNGHADLIRESIDGDRRARSTIRPLTEADWPQVWPFFDDDRRGPARPTPTRSTSRPSRPRALDDERRPGQTVVLEEDGQILGSATMGPNRPGRGSHVGTASFMVSPAARGRGVGRTLAEYVVQWHRDAGFRGDPVQRRRRDQHRRRTPVAVARLHDRRHRAGGLRLSDARAGRPARDAQVARREDQPVGWRRQRTLPSGSRNHAALIEPSSKTWSTVVRPGES